MGKKHFLALKMKPMFSAVEETMENNKVTNLNKTINWTLQIRAVNKNNHSK